MADEVQTIEAAAVATPHDGDSSRPAPSQEHVDAVQAHLDAFNEIVGDTPKAPVKEAPKAAPVETPVENAVETPTETPAEEKPVEAAVPETSTLPAAYVRTAKAYGWTDAEIADALKLGQESALRTFERMHASRTQEIQQWAELGRKTRASTPASIVPPAPVAVASSTPSTGLQPIDVKAMVEKFGNAELIEALAGPVNAAIAAVQPIQAEAQATKQMTARTQQEQLGKLVQDFFTAEEMAPFTTAYGTTVSALTPEQVKMRGRVLETADALIAGAAFQGRQLSVQEALSLAHDSVASGFKENMIRNDLKTKIVKRQSAITLKPTAQGRRDQNAPPASRSELIGRTANRLASVFG